MLRLQKLKKDANLFRLAVSVRDENVTAEPVASLFLLSRLSREAILQRDHGSASSLPKSIHTQLILPEETLLWRS